MANGGRRYVWDSWAKIRACGSVARGAPASPVSGQIAQIHLPGVGWQFTHVGARFDAAPEHFDFVKSLQYGLVYEDFLINQARRRSLSLQPGKSWVLAKESQ